MHMAPGTGGENSMNPEFGFEYLGFFFFTFCFFLILLAYS